MGKVSKNCQPGCASNHLQQLVHKEERYDDTFVARSIKNCNSNLRRDHLLFFYGQLVFCELGR